MIMKFIKILNIPFFALLVFSLTACDYSWLIKYATLAENKILESNGIDTGLISKECKILKVSKFAVKHKGKILFDKERYLKECVKTRIECNKVSPGEANLICNSIADTLSNLIISDVKNLKKQAKNVKSF